MNTRISPAAAVPSPFDDVQSQSTPITAAKRPLPDSVSSYEREACFDTSYRVTNPSADPSAVGSLDEQREQIATTTQLTVLAAISLSGEDVDDQAGSLLSTLRPSPPDVSEKVEVVDYSSRLEGVSPDAAYGYFVKNPEAWFGASGITLHPKPSGLKDGARVMLQEPGLPIWAPIEVHLDDKARTVRITTLDGHPLRGVNQFTFSKVAGGTELRQSSVFQMSSTVASGGAWVMSQASALGLQSPLERQHEIWARAHAAVADGAPRNR